MKNSSWVYVVAVITLIFLGNTEVWAGDMNARTETAVNQPGIKLYSKLSERGGNLFFSPYSIVSALGMVYDGARGDTRAQMQKTLHFDRFTPDIMQYSREVLMKGRVSDAELYIANSIWPAKNYSFRPEYIRKLKKYYNVEVRPQDYVKNPERSRRTINSWVEEHTRKRIRDILQKGSVNSDTRLVLVNAIYFRAPWASPFPEEATQKEPFYLTPEQTKTVNMMNKTAKLSCLSTPDATLVKLPYAKGNQSMVLLIPSQKNGLSALEKKLTGKSQQLKTWVSELSKAEVRDVRLSLPRFEMEDSFELNGTLISLGMRDAFTPGKADLSGMDGSRNLYIGMVVHKAFVSVNERETEAAAATAIGIRMSSARIEEPLVVRADHPFLFLIQDERTGAILFMGRVADPKEPQK